MPNIKNSQQNRPNADFPIWSILFCTIRSVKSRIFDKQTKKLTYIKKLLF